MPNTMKPTDLISSGEIAKLAGIYPSAVANWQTRNVGFPEPWGQWSDKFKLWKRDEVEAWLSERNAKELRIRESQIERLRAQIAKLEERV